MLGELNVISLFDGMSNGQIALNRAGKKIRRYYASEVDPFAIQITQKNYPGTKQLGDVRHVHHDGLDLMNMMDCFYEPDIDLLIGGSPCQNFSFAGRQNGMSMGNIEITSLEQYLELKEKGVTLEGESYLFWEYVRLKEECYPRNFLLENVMMNRKWEKIITDTLGVEPVFVDSADVSAQSRKRLYWTNLNYTPNYPEHDMLLRDILETDYKGKYVADTDRNLRHERKPDQKSLCCTKTMYKGAGNNGMTLVRGSNGMLRCLTPLEVERLQTVPEGYTEGVSKTQRYGMLGNGWTVDVLVGFFQNIEV